MKRSLESVLFILLVALLFAGCASVTGFSKSEYKQFANATVAYNSKVDQYNTLVQKYNNLTKVSCIDYADDFPKFLIPLEKVGTSSKNLKKSIKNGNRTYIINSDIQKIDEMVATTKKYISVLNTINNPSENWVISKLSEIDYIHSILPVSKYNDPLGFLNKDKGYTGCIYFSVKGIDLNSIRGSTLIEKGTDAGGSVEIYRSVNDAEERCAYLAEFAESILDAGFYTILGTMVIRTSYYLSKDDQILLTNKIFKKFTAIPDKNP